MIYRSNLTAPDIQPLFVNAGEHLGTYGHTILHDNQFDANCGYMSHDEAAILYNVAKCVRGDWCEIGSHTGWSAAHIAIAGNLVDLIDPDYVRLDFAARTQENLQAVGVLGTCVLHPVTSEQFWQKNNQFYDGVVIDGNHDAPMPLQDAKWAIPWLKNSAVLFFHDFGGRPIRDAVRFCVEAGFSFRIYNTPEMIAVCYRNLALLPQHIGDPKVDWKKRRAQYHDFDYRGES